MRTSPLLWALGHLLPLAFGGATLGSGLLVGAADRYKGMSQCAIREVNGHRMPGMARMDFRCSAVEERGVATRLPHQEALCFLLRHSAHGATLVTSSRRRRQKEET